MRSFVKFLGVFLAVALMLIFLWLVHANGAVDNVLSDSSAPDQVVVNTAGTGVADTGREPDTSLDLQCESAIAVDVDSGDILYEKNTHEQLYPASLTKLMTALLLSEHDGKSEKLIYSGIAKKEPSNKMDFPAGSRLTADNAMKALLIFSANDIASMVAENISGSVDAFADLMNAKAQSLGMKDTHFVNANGLTDAGHYSSAYDISILALKVYKDPWIISTMETSSALVKTDSGRGITVYNTNKTLDENGCFAGKTGNTSAAGWCLAAFYHHNGHTILGVVLKSPNEDNLYKDMNKLMGSL